MNLKEFGPNIWVAEGPPVRAFGPVTLDTRMIVVRLADGSLWINSPVEASQEDMASVSRLGTVAYLVSPTPLHAWRLTKWKAAYPAAKLCGIVRNPNKARSYDIDLREGLPEAWLTDLDRVVFRGNALLDEVEFFHLPSRTLIFTDFMQNHPARPGRPLFNIVARIAGVLDGGVPTDIRATFIRRDLGRDAIRRILAWDFDRMILAHGPCTDQNAKSVVANAFRWLGDGA